jgi:soluble lytic murein transglycosylase-like protein
LTLQQFRNQPGGDAAWPRNNTTGKRSKRISESLKLSSEASRLSRAGVNLRNLSYDLFYDQKEMKLVKVMKKYIHLLLFTVLLFNVTANAQNIQNIRQPGNQRAAATEELNRTEIGPLQSLGRAATTLALMTAEIVVPMAPLYSPEPETIEAAPPRTPVFGKALIQAEANTSAVVGASATAISWARVSGSGFRDEVSRSLKGQTTGSERIDEIIVNAATQHGVEPLLLFSVMHQESAFNSGAISPKGARGLMQLMPATAARFGVKNIFDPEQNIDGAAQYLRFLLDMFDGNVSLALAGYNAGEGAVKKYGNAVPPYPETINYVRKIKRRYITLTTLSE